MSYFNVIFDCAGFLVVLGLVTTIVSETDKSLARYFILPMILLCAHVYGNTVQELELGPEWIRNHLHNAGVAGMSLTVGLCFNLRDMKRDRRLGYDTSQIMKITMSQTLYFWLAASVFGVLQEIVTVAIWGEESRRAGYSGELDWFDMSAYAIGAIIVTLNYLWFRSRIPTRVQWQSSGSA